MSCATKQPAENRPFERPEVPDPYDQDGELVVAYNPDKETVELKKFYWFKVVRYMIDAEAALDIAEGKLQETKSE